ncbi:hypothetical protein I3843_13G060000 [Carya illinoinensis]|nr:hypothetical protein I3843_13G060000 [Carya illinoinensis]
MEEQDQESSVRDGRRSSNKGEACEELRQYMYCIFSNVCFAGYNIVSKAALDKGMNRYVLVAYGQIFGILATVFFALIFERNINSKLSVAILRNVFLLGLVGSVLGRTLFFAGLEYTSPTFAAALANLIPSITFILAVLCRMEKVDLSKRGSQAKILGTIIAFGGATLMTLYKGPAVISFHSQRSHQPTTGSRLLLDKDLIKGSLILVISYISLSAFYILQGIVIFGITIYIQTLVVRKKGPVFMTAFRPLFTIVVAIMGLLILGDALYMGSIIGATLIVLGLYATLWGKEKEKADQKRFEQTITEEVIEIKEVKQ